jgi:hypothetical protein
MNSIENYLQYCANTKFVCMNVQCVRELYYNYFLIYFSSRFVFILCPYVDSVISH